MSETRVLCKRCIDDYRMAGYKVVILLDKNKEPCDKCERQGYVCEIIKRGGGIDK